MALMVRILFVILFHGLVILAYDPSPVQDYCVATTDPATPCKDSSLVTIDDFVFSGLNSPGEFDHLGLAGKYARVDNFPGLKTQGISFGRADLKVGTAFVDEHPRGAQGLYVLKGTLYTGFINSQDKVLAKNISKGDLIVFPQGLVHFQLNVGDEVATVLVFYNSEYAGMSMIPRQVFGCGVNDRVLKNSFGLSVKEIYKVRDYLGLGCNVRDSVLRRIIK